MSSRTALFLSAVLLIILYTVSGQECDCNYNAHCRPSGDAKYCKSKNVCSGNCVGIGEWAYCRPNPFKCDMNSVAPFGFRNEKFGAGGHGAGGHGGGGGGLPNGQPTGR